MRTSSRWPCRAALRAVCGGEQRRAGRESPAVGARLCAPPASSVWSPHGHQLAEQCGATLDLIIGPLTLADLLDFKRLNPNIRTLGLVPGEEFAAPDHAAAEEFARAGADIIRLWPPWIFSDRDQNSIGGTSQLIERMHDLGKPVWTTADVAYSDINPERPGDDLAELVRLGVNGVLTDVPELLRDLLATRSTGDQGTGRACGGR